MKLAADILEPAINEFQFHEPCVPVISNVTAQPVPSLLSRHYV
jgi:hypothetical protein